ncbi:MAG: phosphonopyruvate decarboxylase [Nanoarchaeota archaeon]|nr:phosphonopyruvate decarboxylase [Nanoarchaeota archaeon]
MLNPKEFYHLLIENKVDFFAGVPDSLLKDFNAYVMDNTPQKNHTITHNEGGAIALVTGYHLATNKMGLVYMQNSGLGNTVNPLTSLADREVYSIPMLILIGWRGEPGVHDEPQHVKQGRITLSLLETLEIPYSILPDNIAEARKTLEDSISHSKQNNIPYALIVRKGTFETYELRNKTEKDYQINREKALKLIIDNLDERDIIVSTTGMLSRELFEYRKALEQSHNKDFLTVGCMGHSSMLALGIALLKPSRNIYCLDGDGSLIMHLGSLAIIGQKSPNNFKHVVFNNGAHDSVGGQPTAGLTVDVLGVAEACGYKEVIRAETKEEILNGFSKLKKSEGPSLLEILIKKGSRKDLGRPTTPPIENKKDFMQELQK